jgi:uncharacterized protein YcfJ
MLDERTKATRAATTADQNGRLYRGDSTANGTLLGAVIGGALGNQVGKGDGRTAATVAGAVIGGVVGNNVDRNHTARLCQRVPRPVRRRCVSCRQVSDNGGRFGGYDVTYRYAGQTYHALMNYRPSRTMRVMVQVRPQFERGVARRTECSRNAASLEGPFGALPFLLPPAELAELSTRQRPPTQTWRSASMLQHQFRVAAHLAALADPEAVAERAERAALVEEGGDGSVGGAGRGSSVMPTPSGKARTTIS